MCSYSQNLIPNPGFEMHDSCPVTTSQVEYCTGWINVEGSPDYHNSCALGNICSVPYNYFGFQQAHSGCAYCGVYTREFPNYREYIQASLLTTLTIGQKYYFSFYLNLMNGYSWSSGTNKFGFRLSTIPYVLGNNGSPATDNYATFYSDSILIDTINWTKISGSIIADSAYKYITFGNFFDDSNTQFIILTGSPTVRSYYYIDDICLSTDSLTCVSVTDSCQGLIPVGINEASAYDIKVYPNPFLDEIVVENKNNNEELEIEIRDIDGRILYTKTFIGQNRCELTGLKKGMYFYEVRKKGRLVKTGKIIKD